MDYFFPAGESSEKKDHFSKNLLSLNSLIMFPEISQKNFANFCR